MATISVVINTLNAQRLLDEVLDSVKDADEIIICDMHSEDDTIEIAQRHKCKIFYHDRTGIVEPARNWAMEQATGDWILVLDADEIVTPELWKYLRQYADNPKKNRYACYIPRETYLLGKHVHSWRQSGIKRFWKRGNCHYTEEIHKMPVTHEGKDFWINKNGKLPNAALIHYHIPSLNHFGVRLNNYTDFELKRFLMKNKKFKLSKLLFRPPYEFFKLYVMKGGYKDGIHGFVFAVIMAYYKFLQWAKLWEYEFVQKNKDLRY